MKNLFYFLIGVCLFASCKKEPTPDPLVVTTTELEGTWVYTGDEVTEVIKFTSNGKFYYTNNLSDAAFVRYEPGSYSVTENVNLTAFIGYETFEATITKMQGNSFTAKKSTGESVEFHKLISTLDLGYGQHENPDYSLVKGSIVSYTSDNIKVATVDKAGCITAIAEGLTLIKVKTKDEGTAVILVKAEGLIPDYTKAIGYTKEEVLAKYGDVEETTGTMIVYNTEDKNLEFSINRRTGLVVQVTLIYKQFSKDFTKANLTKYLENKYYKDASVKTPPYVYTDMPTFDKSNAKITWDNNQKVEFTYINHDMFEDFSVALGKSKEEIEEMYYVDCEQFVDFGSFIECKIGKDMLGYVGLNLIGKISFFFDGDYVNVIDVSLVSPNATKINAFLAKKYIYSSEDSEEDSKMYYDTEGKISIEYLISDKKIRYRSL